MTLKVGVIGVGGIARAHMPGWAASTHAEVVAGCDINPLALQQWGRDFGIQQLSTNPDDIINDPDIDIIDISTPNAYHAAQTIAALEAGKHVMCEKPLAPTAAEIEKMIEIRDKTGKMLMTAQHHRFSNDARALKREIDNGQLGEIYHARVWALRRIALPAKPTFVMNAHSGGGVCIDMGVHLIDLVMWMLNHPKPVSVTGVARTELARKQGAFTLWGDNALLPLIDVEEFAAAFIRFEDGATLIMETSWMLHHNTPVEEMKMWLYGKEGGAEWPEVNLLKTSYETQQIYTTKLGLIDDPLPARALECVEFVQAIVDDAPSPVPAEESLKVARILDAVYESQKTGREVRLD